MLLPEKNIYMMFISSLCVEGGRFRSPRALFKDSHYMDLQSPRTELLICITTLDSPDSQDMHSFKCKVLFSLDRL